MKPLLLIDVDGVLNPYAADSCPEGYTEHKILGYQVRLNPEHGEWLLSLQDRFELTWGTAWEEHANKYLSPRLGLPQLPVAHFPRSQFGGHTSASWKLPGIKEYVGDRAFAWIDDDINGDVYDWTSGRKAPSGLLLVDPSVGLRYEDILSLRRWSGGLV